MTVLFANTIIYPTTIWYVTQIQTLILQISLLMHPSPVNPAANKGWREIAIKQLTESKVIQYFKPEA